jgi:cobalt-zinc-cadmium efflux system outer membrane protein
LCRVGSFDLESILSRLFILWLSIATSLTWAQDAVHNLPPLTLPQAAERVLLQNPRLRAAEYSRETAAADLETATLTPQWSVSVDVERFLGTGVNSGFDASETTLMLSRIFLRSDTREGRIALASAQGHRMDNALVAERLDLLAILARRFLEVVYQQEQYALAEREVDTWLRATELALARERAGAAPAVHRLQTEIRTARAGLTLEDAEHELDAARVLLAAAWGDKAADFGVASASICSLSNLLPFETLAEQIENTPDVLRFATDQRLYEAEVRLAETRRRASWTLSAGVRHLALTDDEAFVFSASIPLGSKSRAAPAIRRSNALRQASALQEQDTRAAIRATLYELYQETLHTITAVDLYNDEILPRVGEILKQIEDGYRLGRFSHLELMNAQGEMLGARAARLSACMNHHSFLIDIERLTGGGVVWLTTEGGVAP